MEDVPASADKPNKQRRTSWLPIPENPSRPLPRSLTLGNLGISTRQRQPAISIETSSLFPAVIIHDEKITRSRIPSAPRTSHKRPDHPSSLQRSDTEPLLPPADTSTTASLSPTTLTALPPPTPKPSSKKTDWRGLQISARSQKLPASTDSPCGRTLGVGGNPKNRLIGPPSKGLPRFNTQPNLNATLVKVDVTAHKLLTPKQAPTPIPRSPLANVDRHVQPKTVPRSLLQQTRCFFSSSPVSTVSEQLPRSPWHEGDTIKSFEPLGYWCGRFNSILDRAQTSIFQHRCDRGMTSATDTTEQRRERIATAMAALYASCGSEEAENSLRIFHAYLRTMQAKISVGDEEGIASRMTWSDVVAAGNAEKMKRPATDSFAESSTKENTRATGRTVSQDGPEDGAEKPVRRLSVDRRTTFMKKLLGRKAKVAQ